jgi:hypothetical protein
MILQMSSQNTDDLILCVESIIRNRCSLLDEDRRLLSEVIVLLKKYKREQGEGKAANELLVVKAVELLTKFFGK